MSRLLIACLLAVNMTVYAATTPHPNTPTADNPSDTPTLAKSQSPTQNELLTANTELLAKNIELQHRIDELTTQVNVLVNERSGQLFLYGAISTVLAFLSGVVVAKFFVRKRKSDW